MLNFEIFEKLDDRCLNSFEELIPNSYYNFFQNYDYLEHLILEEDSEIKIVAIYDNKKIIAILPLEIKRYFIFKILQWIGTKRSDFCNPILSKNFHSCINNENFISLWKKILEKIGGYDLIFLNNQLSKVGDCENPFVKHLKAIKFSKIHQINLPNNFQKFLKNQKTKDKKKYYEIHRTIIKLKKLNDKFDVFFDIKKLPNEKISFRQIIENKKNQLKSKGIKHNLDEKFIKVFTKLINKRKREDTKFFITSLKVENEDISSCFGIIFDKTFYYYIPFIQSNNHNKFKPGKILTLKLIEWCIENKIKFFDFGLGEEKYKEYFSNHTLDLYRFVEHKNLFGKLLLFMMKIIYYNKSFQ